MGAGTGGDEADLNKGISIDEENNHVDFGQAAGKFAGENGVTAIKREIGRVDPSTVGHWQGRPQGYRH